MTTSEAVRAFHELVEIAHDGGIDPLEAFFTAPAHEDFCRIHIRLAPEEERDTAAIDKATLLLELIQRRGVELGFHPLRSMFYILFTA